MSTFYVDRGMAWCTVVGGFVANFLLGGLAKSYGMVMEAYQEVFNSGSAYLLLAGGLIYTLMYCLSLANHFISERYGSRPVVLTGALGSCISLLIAAYSPNLALWVVAIGVGLGASLSCIYFTVFSVVGRCFKRYLGLANGISVAGVSVGQMAFPALITYLNQHYGPRGGTVIMAGLCLHLLITAVLMPRYIVDPDAPPPVAAASPDKSQAKKKKKKKKRWMMTKKSKYADVQSNGCTDPGVQDISSKEYILDEFYAEVDRAKPVKPAGDAVSLKSEKSQTKLDPQAKLARSLSRSLLIVYILAKILGDIGDVSVSFIAPAHGTKLGFDPVTVSRAIAVAGAVDLVSRLGVGWLTDRPACLGRRGLLLSVTWLVEGLNALAFAELNQILVAYQDPSLNYDHSNGVPIQLTIGYYICFGIHGVCSGTAMTQMVVVLCDWVGSDRLAYSLALTMVILGVLISPGQFAIGFLADVCGDYVWPMRLCGVILILAGFTLLFEFPVRFYYKSKTPSIIPANEKYVEVAYPLPGPDGNASANSKWITYDSDPESAGEVARHVATLNHADQVSKLQPGFCSGPPPSLTHLAMIPVVDSADELGPDDDEDDQGVVTNHGDA